MSSPHPVRGVCREQLGICAGARLAYVPQYTGGLQPPPPLQSQTPVPKHYSLTLTLSAPLLRALLRYPPTAGLSPPPGSARTPRRYADGIGEVLKGMLTVKLNCWEGAMQRHLSALKFAVGALENRRALMMTVINPVTNISVDLISLALVYTYVFGLGLHMSAATLGLTWVLLSILHGRVFEFPVLIKEV